MDIFISGDLTTFAHTIAEKLLEEGHSIVVSGKSDPLVEIRNRNFISYEMQENENQINEIFHSHSFDAVIHIAPRMGGICTSSPSTSAINNDALQKILSISAKTDVGKFILISSLDIYGTVKMAAENTDPQPNTAYGQQLVNAETLCKFFHKKEALSICTIRVPFVYGPNENNSLIADLIRQSKTTEIVSLAANRLDHCNFLHVDDLTRFLECVLDEEKDFEYQTFNLAVEDINFDFLCQQFNLHFPDVEYRFPEEETKAIIQKKVEVSNAARFCKWAPQHILLDDLPEIAHRIEAGEKTGTPFREKLKKFSNVLRPFLVWIEMIFGAFLMHMLVVWTNTIIEFKYIDYRLIYVVIIGSIHGLFFGILASLLAAASAIISWHSVGLDYALLIYNVENWIPFAVYFLAGSVTGYLRDKKENEIQFERNQAELIHEKYEFLYTLYNEISTIKNRLREQLVGYRDSFGRFFRIANELNDLDEDNIFFKALEILEDLMKNDQIAIYSIESTGNYGRLEVKSKTLLKDIPKSMRLDDLSKAMGTLKDGNVFQNKDLIANYPSYIAPIINNGILIGLVVIWETKFEQFNLYYLNLFKVITGLIQSSLVRAATFKNAQVEKLYIPATRIMKPEVFKQALSIKKKMRRNKMSDFQIMQIDREKQEWKSLFEKLSMGIRADDIAGVLDEDDTTCYVLLANAGVENLPLIQERIRSNGVHCEPIEDLEIE